MERPVYVHDYATVEDVILIFRTLTADEREKAGALIPIVCSQLRNDAREAGIDLEAKINADPDFANIAKSVVVDVVARHLLTPTSGSPMSQMSESALGYSFSGTFLNPGGGLFIKKSEYARLGIKRQKIGAINVWP